MKQGIKNILISLLILHILIAMLFIVDLIPTNLVYSNCYESIDELNSSRIMYDIGYMYMLEDRNADASMFNMIMHKDSDHLHNVMKPRLYGEETQQYLSQVNSYLRHEDDSVHEYIQYWHGYRILWTPLLMLMTANKIKILIIAIVIILIATFLYQAYKNKDYYLMTIFSIASMMFIVPVGCITLEYIPVTLITLICTILAYRDKLNTTSFLTIGIVTAFLDYLTAETLTFTIPCFILFYKNRLKLSQFIKSGICWILGYLGTFLYKYLLLTIIYKENYFIKVKDIYIDHFLSDEIPITIEKTLMRQLELFYSKATLINIYTIIIVLILSFLMIYLLKDNKTTLEKLVISILLFIIPILRFCVLKRHSYSLSYMTFRAIMVCFLILCYHIRHNKIIEKLHTVKIKEKHNQSKEI